MTEETPTPDQVPADPAPLPPASNPESGETQFLPTQDSDAYFGEAPGDSGQVAPAVPAETFAPPAPAASPLVDPWAPAAEAPIPTPEDDAAMREQRALRYGVPEATPAADPVFPAPTEAAPAAPAAPQPMFPADSSTSMPAVTPLPATQYSEPIPPPAAPTQTATFPADAPTQHVYEEFAGLDDGPVTRAAAHWWTILITLIFAPVAWYLFTDGGARIEWAGSQGTSIAVASYIEFGLGLLAVFIFLLAARWSSVGSIVMGSIFFALGVAFLAFPADVGKVLFFDAQEYFARLGQFGLNVHEHLTATLVSGRMAVYGLVLIMVGVISHGARRQGRREERTKIALGE